jgi:hypothetical protein
MATTEGYEGDPQETGAPAPSSAANAPMPDLVTSAVGDRCSNCGAPLASDQRYCVECGQRRGKPRFSVANQTAAAAPKREKRRVPRPGGSSGAVLVAGIATLLLAMGVGFEIGHDSKTSTTKQAAAAPEVITVNGGGSAPSTDTTATTASNNNNTSSKSSKTTKAPKQTKVVVQKTNDAASKQLGTSAKNLVNNPTVQQGSQCSGGAGCQNGHFTGNFFGGGGG